MTLHEMSFLISQVHSPTLAVAEHLAGRAGFGLLHPGTVAVGLEAVFPHIPEVLLIDIALIVFATDAGASGDTAINEHRSHTNACGTMVEVVAHLALISTQKAFTSVGGMNAFVLTTLYDEVEHLVKPLVGDEQVWMLLGTPGREDGEETPIAHACLVERVTELRKVVDIAVVHTSDHIPDDLSLTGQQTDSPHGGLIAVLIPSHPVVVVLQTIQTHGHAAKSCGTEAMEAFGGKGKTIRDHSPRVFSLIERTTHLLYV